MRVEKEKMEKKKEKKRKKSIGKMEYKRRLPIGPSVNKVMLHSIFLPQKWVPGRSDERL